MNANLAATDPAGDSVPVVVARRNTRVIGEHRPQGSRRGIRPAASHRPFAWLFWCAIRIYFLISLRNRFMVALQWLWDSITFRRSVRLIP